jgi:CRP-like cAMP-binding protein
MIKNSLTEEQYSSLEILVANITRYITLSVSEKEYFFSLLSFRALKSHEYLLNENEICKDSAFVVKGCLRAYTIDKNGYEHVLSFAPVDWWIADLYSLFTGRNATLNIDALSATEVLLLSREKQQQLYLKIPQFERYFRIIIENALVASQQRLLDSLSLDAAERYQNFCKKYPQLIHSIAQKHVASYIGVTPEFLSKLKSQLLKGNR